MELLKRPRRNRVSPFIRDLVQEHRLHITDFIVPFFIIPGQGRAEPIESMPPIKRITIDLLLKELEHYVFKGIRAIALFPTIPKEEKDLTGSLAYLSTGLIPTAVAIIKKAFPNLFIICDVALDPYTSHGHDGIIDANGKILNDKTVEALREQALVLAAAGADAVAPSDMMDGRIRGIRERLDQSGFTDTNIISYAAKYASAFYDPFRDAVGSAPSFGDKKTYQMNPANAREALLEAHLDEEEGADILMVKPASLYLDIIYRIKTQTNLPIAAYHVSGEYAMIVAAQEKGYLDGAKAFHETLLSIKRAGADMIFTYALPFIEHLL
jgi:porphobilinogen synthase